MTQPLNALAHGQQIRWVAIDAKRRVRAHRDTRRGFAQLAGEIAIQPRWPRKLRVAEALTWPWRSDWRQRRRLLACVGCSEQRTLNELTDRQREVLCAALRDPSLWRGDERAAAA